MKVDEIVPLRVPVRLGVREKLGVCVIVNNWLEVLVTLKELVLLREPVRLPDAVRLVVNVGVLLRVRVLVRVRVSLCVIVAICVGDCERVKLGDCVSRPELDRVLVLEAV